MVRSYPTAPRSACLLMWASTFMHRCNRTWTWRSEGMGRQRPMGAHSRRAQSDERANRSRISTRPPSISAETTFLIPPRVSLMVRKADDVQTSHEVIDCSSIGLGGRCRGLAASSGQCQLPVGVCARCRGGDASPLHGASRRTTCRLRRGDAAVSLSLYAAPTKKARSSGGSHCDSTGCRRGGIGNGARLAPFGGRQVVRGAHDLTDGCRRTICPESGDRFRTGARVARVSLASGRPSRHAACRAFGSSADSDAFSSRDGRCAGRSPPLSSALQQPRASFHLTCDRRRGPFLPSAEAVWEDRCPRLC